MGIEMKHFKNCAAQGDLLIRRVESLPEGIIPVESEKGVFVVAHSETGHNHVIISKPHIKYFNTSDPMVSYLQVIEATDEVEVFIEHLRSFHTHESIAITPGIFEIRRQREATLEGWRKSTD
jgi:hypothetical protein